MLKGLKKAIDYAVLFIVLYIVWQIMRILVLPNLEIFPYLEPLEFWLPVYGMILTVSHYLMIAIMVIIMCLYIAWLIVRKIFKYDLKKIPPWKQLSKAGLLQLIHSIAGIIFSKRSFQDRFKRVFISFGGFLIGSYQYTLGTVFGKAKGYGAPVPSDNSIAKVRDESKKDQAQQDELDSKQSAMSAFTKDERQDINDRYLQCVEEKSEVIYPEMTSMQKANIIAKNESVATSCKLGSFQGYANILSFR